MRRVKDGPGRSGDEKKTRNLPQGEPPQQAAQKNEFCFFLVFFKWILEKKLESTSIFRKFITSFVTRFFQNKTQQKTKPHLDFELFYFGLLFSCFFLVFFDRVVSFAGPPFFF